jgi:hypothetical protein
MSGLRGSICDYTSPEYVAGAKSPFEEKRVSAPICSIRMRRLVIYMDHVNVPAWASQFRNYRQSVTVGGDTAIL